ncbi:heparan-alpha-glucosaminide N-acetyltransferase domain-containing protein [Brasilonema sp. UFV-L1]|uniref:heparan-alpha-glucosaminide N-acetyltransferase domain-containing protein n=1 Tax=Brasilonema sp. UFV-L1 TaxID=2234130 RepID=UPI00145D58DC|nr:heparan-alpha-glucosaminide N-acetyltransferase domain-containing protein [Brasilonema sp. UFV-L1]NMG06317.1 hypothetical protein [Brasilonema sp. UFV-L1]
MVLQTEQKYKRDFTIDTLRGIAIFTMVAANLAALALKEPHPFWFRLYGTWAAPMFILLSGFMVAYTSKKKKYNFRHFLVRGLMLLLIAVLIDTFIFRIYPFTGVDILYLIAVSSPLAYFFQNLKTFPQCAILTGIFLLTPLLQKTLGYTDYPTQLYLFTGRSETISNQTSIINHWLIDGWFPLFPWVGFSFLGVLFAKLRKFYPSFARRNILLGGGAIFFVGSIVWWFYPGKLLTRGGYSELFYPPTIGYIMVAIGLMTMLFYLVDTNPSLNIYKPLQVLGQSSLFIYILHNAIIAYVIPNLGLKNDIFKFFSIYIVLASLLILIAYGLRAVKKRWRNSPYVIRFIIGG